ncbi:Nucleotide-binding universal stress protein, UspA family [Cribrihabitans marinus]|uniref:Nucleotide-binding universal stress protein, UspA family n=1 Tax=Cribrihabitans marinus TaxID=1227549 RepID=A0A1H6YKF1_9RHOB|nr:universal stress protein [Cribrihabitans marinus]GGH29425.1 universal stress protein UspA [Cribrihabitans marinus]SEJ41798.1 Nucleotide-binding universal stress protein, UspA family [Cribrihabitans marinus]
MSKTILCAVDINRPDAERKVLEVALKLADLDKAQLDVITVVPDFGMSVVGAYFQDHQIETAKDSAGDLLRQFVSEVAGPDRDEGIRHVVAMGNVYDEVLRAAELEGSDLIVIGAHRPDLKDYLLGPNASRVVRHSNCSVYVVR